MFVEQASILTQVEPTSLKITMLPTKYSITLPRHTWSKPSSNAQSRHVAPALPCPMLRWPGVSSQGHKTCQLIWPA